MWKFRQKRAEPHKTALICPEKAKPLSLRDRINADLMDMSGPLGPFYLRCSDGWDILEYQQKWIAEAPPECFDALVDLLRSPPDLSAYSEWVRKDWPDNLSVLLSGMAARNPALALPKLAPLLTEIQPRIPILDAIGSAGSMEAYRLFGKDRNWTYSPETLLIEQAVALLWSLFPELNTLSDEELAWWIDALGDIGGPTRPLLMQVYHALPPDKTGASKQIALRIDKHYGTWIHDSRQANDDV